ncbi:MAG: T9SS type A sorting domain-containing protein [Paludibacteraceae bacterium]|nr:T9SS type A sorting domain-containing protein [Paludibacteraceae bacterium]
MKKIVLTVFSLLLLSPVFAAIDNLVAVPSGSSLSVRFDDDQSQEINLTVYNFLGQPLYSSLYMTSEGHNVVRIDNLSLYRGTYMVKITTRSGEVKILRFNN